MTPMLAATPSNGVAADVDIGDKIPARRFFVKLPWR